MQISTDSISKALDGKKLYITALVGIVGILLVNLGGISVPGVVASHDWPTQVWEIILAMTARSAVGKINVAP